MVLENIKVDIHNQGKCYLAVTIKLKEGKRLTIVNLYLPPASNLTVNAKRDMWKEVHDTLRDIPINDAVIILRDLNAHIRNHI